MLKSFFLTFCLDISENCYKTVTVIFLKTSYQSCVCVCVCKCNAGWVGVMPLLATMMTQLLSLNKNEMSVTGFNTKISQHKAFGYCEVSQVEQIVNIAMIKK